MRIRWIGLALVVVATLAFAACGGGGNGDAGGNDPDGNDPGTITITAPTGAANTGFTPTSIAAPADAPFTLRFVNDDGGIPHNVQIFEGADATGTPVFAPEGNELITGVAETDYRVPALPAGTYTFNCLAHPATMVGTLTAG
jgi:plastocyanin